MRSRKLCSALCPAACPISPSLPPSTCVLPQWVRLAYAGGWPHSALYAVRLTSLTEAPSASAKRVTASERDVQFGYCGLSGLLTNQTGERERSLIAGSYYGVMYYYRNMADSGIAFRGRVPLVDNTGAFCK